MGNLKYPTSMSFRVFGDSLAALQGNAEQRAAELFGPDGFILERLDVTDSHLASKKYKAECHASARMQIELP